MLSIIGIVSMTISQCVSGRYFGPSSIVSNYLLQVIAYTTHRV